MSRRLPGLRALAVRRPAMVTIITSLITVALCSTSLASNPFSTTTSQNTTVTVTFANNTSLTTTSCASGQPGRTNLGTPLPGTTQVSNQDCSVVFGSTTDTSMLRIRQRDESGAAVESPGTGVLDTGWDGPGAPGNGKFSLDFGTANDNTFGVIPLRNGDTLAFGWSQPSTVACTAGRLNADGSLDSSFGTGGIGTISLGGADLACLSAAEQTDGKIVVAGFIWGVGPFVGRFTTAGLPDPTFSGDGLSLPEYDEGFDFFYDVKLQADGQILGAGGSGTAAQVMRLTANGTVDTHYAGDGVMSADPGNGDDRYYGVRVLSDGGAIAVGTSVQAGASRCLISRISSAGVLDATFDGDSGTSNGNVIVDIAGTTNEACYGVDITPDGYIIVTGETDQVTANSSNAVVMKLDSVGRLDTTFDGNSGTSNGIVTLDTNGFLDELSGVVALPDGRIVSSGSSSSNGTDADFFTAVFDQIGRLDTTFSTDGWDRQSIGTNDTGYRVAVTPDGRFTVAGNDGVGANGVLIQYATGPTISDYDSTNFNWAGTGSNLFGVCLRAMTTSTVVAPWTIDANGDCTTSDTDPWRRVPRQFDDTASKVATLSTPTTGTVNFRFGLRTSSNQTPADYAAPIVFEVLAPNV